MSSSTTDVKLFAEFPPVTTEQWMEVVTKDLKGADFNRRLVTKTEDGISIKPFYRKEDLPAAANTAPGFQPYQRGYKTTDNNWSSREQIRESGVQEANAHALRCLSRGAEELSFLCYPIGVNVRTAADVEKLLEGVFIEMVPIHWQAGPLSPQVLSFFVAEAKRRGVALDQLSGSIELDPITDAAAGWRTGSVDNWKGFALPVVKYVLANLPGVKALTIRGSQIEKAGASAAQELAFVLSLLTEYLAGLGEAGVDLKALIKQTEIRFSVGSNYFLEIAKLRAARVLLSNVLSAFGVEGVSPTVHADTTTSNKTLYDPHNNILRATTEAMAAAMAGVDSLTVSTFDQVYNTPDEFSEHISRNTETLLKEEAFLTKVVDPLGGSYTVEALTESLAHAAWDLFKKIEAEGGFLAAWKSGTIQADIEKVRQAKAKDIRSRRRSIVGTSTYPNLKEARLADIAPRPAAKVIKDWNDSVGSIEELAKSNLSSFETATPVGTGPLSAYRLSQPYESLRLAVEKHVAKGGKKPVVFLALLGDVVRRKARAGFATGFYGAAGYEIVEAAPFKDVDSAAAAAKEAKADIVVVCSSDDEYATLVGALKKALTGLGIKPQLVVAGAPETMEQLKADGAEEFVHIKSDVIATLGAAHRLLGIAQEQNS